MLSEKPTQIFCTVGRICSKSCKNSCWWDAWHHKTHPPLAHWRDTGMFTPVLPVIFLIISLHCVFICRRSTFCFVALPAITYISSAYLLKYRVANCRKACTLNGFSHLLCQHPDLEYPTLNNKLCQNTVLFNWRTVPTSYSLNVEGPMADLCEYFTMYMKIFWHKITTLHMDNLSQTE
jgi:hypothetical protein